MPENWEIGGFGLYVHWPFCQAKCPYCDFNSHVRKDVDQDLWSQALVTEIYRHAELTKGRTLSSIFFGGGTPSLMNPIVVSEVIEAARSSWQFSSDIEITLEANPTSVEAAKFKAIRDGGVNRVSIGVQALNNRDLQLLGRLHTVGEALQAVSAARETFDRVSFDLIYARQHQTLGDWSSELSRALELGPDHLSLYQLTIENGTAFGDRFALGKLPGLPDDDLSADMFEFTQDATKRAGLPAYEVSNHAKKGQEGRHNLIYWSGGDYVGVGPGAHGRLTLGDQRIATAATLNPGTWLNDVSSGQFIDSHSILSAQEQDCEYLMMSLRTVQGAEISRISRGLPSFKNLQRLIDDSFVEINDGWIQVTPKGRLVLNGVLRELLTDSSS